jgi:hypothetical protein
MSVAATPIAPPGPVDRSELYVAALLAHAEHSAGELTWPTDPAVVERLLISAAGQSLARRAHGDRERLTRLLIKAEVHLEAEAVSRLPAGGGK